MYGAVLVDDENYDLEGLRCLIPWSELGIEVVCSESNPLAALQYIENHEIDLLITDIRMPAVSGMELSRLALEPEPGAQNRFHQRLPGISLCEAGTRLEGPCLRS